MRRFESENDTLAIRGAKITSAILTAIEALLAVRFFLKLAGANENTVFSSLIYNLTSVLSDPFLEIFPPTPIMGGAVIEWSAIFAMALYWVFASAFARMFLDQRKEERRQSVLE
ncbi:MAG: YggT family protein [Candidatus Paceibacterota bacterium]|jgi:uncharacterized protein YggT (Ycf19 family)|nr:YggT family protein [Candidatus Paceibacterota bacterium]